MELDYEDYQMSPDHSLVVKVLQIVVVIEKKIAFE